MKSLKDEATHIDIDGYLWKDVVFDSEGNAKEGVYLEDTTWLHSYIKELKLKPIEKKEMKEFLVNHNGKWTLQLLDSDTEENSYRVAVPSEADIYVYFCGDERAYFYNPSNEVFENRWMNASHKVWSFNEIKKGVAGEILWQRSETESLNDQYAEIEKARQETVKVTIDELKHRVYKKDVSHLDYIDVYRVLELFNVQSHAVGHAIKKLLCSGGRGAKDEAQDIQEAIDSLIRYQEMKNEDS